MTSEEISTSAVKGSIFFLILAWFSTGIIFILNIVLARILFPEDFGISSISFTIMGIFSMFVGFGLAPGVIQSKADKDRLFTTFFIVDIITTIAISTTIFFLSGFFANLFMDLRITATVQILTLYIFLFGINSIPKTYLIKELQFKKITLVESFSVIINLGVSLTMALTGFGYWSLIYGPLAAIVFRSIVYWIIAPIIPKISNFDQKIFRSLLKFATPILMASIVIFWSVHIDDMMIVQILGLTFLGFYTLSYSISNYLATLITHPISSALYPIYCKIQDSPEEMKSTFEKNYRMILTITLFITFFILVNAESIIVFLFGDKWLCSIPILQILILEGFLRSLAAITGNLFQALNKYYWVLIISTIYFVVMTPLMIIATIYFGIIGTATVVTVTYVPVVVLSFWLLKKYINYKIVKDTLIRVLGAVLMLPVMLIVIIYFNFNILFVLGINFGLALGIYSVVLHYFTKGEFLQEIKTIYNIFFKK